MGYWNYRVIKKHHQETDTYAYQVHEVYYKKSGKIEGWSESPVSPMGETLNELRGDIQSFSKAFQKPVLREKNKKGKLMLVPEKDNQKINVGHYFELMDRSAVAIDFIYQSIGSHPVIRDNRKLQKLYEKAENILGELYQESGKLEYEKTKNRR